MRIEKKLYHKCRNDEYNRVGMNKSKKLDHLVIYNELDT